MKLGPCPLEFLSGWLFLAKSHAEDFGFNPPLYKFVGTQTDSMSWLEEDPRTAYVKMGLDQATSFTVVAYMPIGSNWLVVFTHVNSSADTVINIAQAVI